MFLEGMMAISYRLMYWILFLATIIGLSGAYMQIYNERQFVVAYCDLSNAAISASNSCITALNICTDKCTDRYELALSKIKTVENLTCPPEYNIFKPSTWYIK